MDENMEQKPKNTGESAYYGPVHESIRGMFEITARIEERVKTMVQKQEELTTAVNTQTALYNNLATRVALLEADQSADVLKSEMVKVQEYASETKTKLHDIEMKLTNVEGSSGRQEDRWKGVWGFLIQLAWVLVAAFLLYKLGLPSP